ncbi:MAG: hypothetical protein WDO74_19715 [Pseudomonadota bacterium]
MLRLAQANAQLKPGDSQQGANRRAAQNQARGAGLVCGGRAILVAQVWNGRQLHARALPERFGQRLAERTCVFEARARDFRQAAREHGVHVRIEAGKGRDRGRIVGGDARGNCDRVVTGEGASPADRFVQSRGQRKLVAER